MRVTSCSARCLTAGFSPEMAMLACHSDRLSRGCSSWWEDGCSRWLSDNNAKVIKLVKSYLNTTIEHILDSLLSQHEASSPLVVLPRWLVYIAHHWFLFFPALRCWTVIASFRCLLAKSRTTIASLWCFANNSSSRLIEIAAPAWTFDENDGGNTYTRRNCSAMY
jgi:hypothetical protein